MVWDVGVFFLLGPTDFFQFFFPQTSPNRGALFFFWQKSHFFVGPRNCVGGGQLGEGQGILNPALRVPFFSVRGFKGKGIGGKGLTFFSKDWIWEQNSSREPVGVGLSLYPKTKVLGWSKLWGLFIFFFFWKKALFGPRFQGFLCPWRFKNFFYLAPELLISFVDSRSRRFVTFKGIGRGPFPFSGLYDIEFFFLGATFP